MAAGPEESFVPSEQELSVKEESRIFVAGHNGMVGSALVRRLQRQGYRNLLLKSRAELDLTDPVAVAELFRVERPEYVFLAAARVGGILANDTYPVPFLRDNLAMELAVIEAAHRSGTTKLMFLGSSCVYPKHAPQPLKEEYLLSGPLEPTNEWYAIAKIAGIKLCQAYRKQYSADFISVMPTNLYGPHDNFDAGNSHVVPALIRRFHEAKEAGLPSVTLWGTGTPRREFLHVDDLADACLFLMQTYSGADPVNIGTGSDLTIAELAATLASIIGYAGHIEYDASKPDGTPRKQLDVSRLSSLGWNPQIPLERGLEATYDWFVKTKATAPASLRT